MTLPKFLLPWIYTLIVHTRTSLNFVLCHSCVLKDVRVFSIGEKRVSVVKECYIIHYTMCVCVCIYIYVHYTVYIYIYIYIHTHTIQYIWASLVAQIAKNLPAVWKTWVQSLSQEDPLEKEMTTYFNILLWEIPWTEEPGRLLSMRLQRVRYGWVTNTHTHTLNICIYTYNVYSVVYIIDVVCRII